MMDGINAESSKHNIAEVRKIAVIDEIVSQSNSAFDNWVLDNSHQKHLDMPVEAMRILIPRRLFEIAEDPLKVSIIPTSRSSDSLLQAIIVERKSTAVSNPESLNKWIMEIKKQEAEQKKAVLKGEKHRFRTPPSPRDVDEFHTRFYELILDGKLTAYDYVTNDMALIGDFEPDVLNVSEYNDREELRKKGVGNNFYRNLHDIAKKLGYRFLTGTNNDDNMSFYTTILGRTSLSQIKPELRHKLHYDPGSKNAAKYTIDFLYDEDKEIFCSAE